MSSSDAIPRTANLLACKHWWKVCFLYGDQEKYYRNAYGKAIAQRFTPEHANLYSNQADQNSFMRQPPLFEKEQTIESKVTVLDDPFLLGLNNDNEIPTTALNNDNNNDDGLPEVLTNMNKNRRSGITDESGTVALAIGKSINDSQQNFSPENQV